MVADGAGASLGSGYVLLDQIGAGAMGSVWRARHRATGEIVAVKLLRDGLAGDQDLVLRFVQERSVMRVLRHPNIVTFRDFIIEGERLALVMDLVEGVDLRTLIQRHGTFPPAEAARLMAQVADALAVAHTHGVVHRDVKPGNVLVDAATGQVRLTDFGVARIVHGPSLTQTASIIGTPTYLAPEVAVGDAPTPAVDVYAVGLILYELLAGRPPFVGQHPIAVLRLHAMAVPRRLPGMPESLWSVISACTSKDPAERPAVEWVATALREAAPSLTGLPALPPVTWADPLSATADSLDPSGANPPGPPGAAMPVAAPAAASGETIGRDVALSKDDLSGRDTVPSAASSAVRYAGEATPPVRHGRSRRRRVVMAASAATLAVSAAAVAAVVPWRAFGVMDNRAVSVQVSVEPADQEIGPVRTPSLSPTTSPTSGREARPTRSGTPQPPVVSEPAGRPSPRATVTRARHTPTPTRRPVRSPSPIELDRDKPRVPDATRKEPQLEWRCREWFSPTPGLEMSPCMAVVGDVFHMLGRIRGSSTLRSDIYIELFDSTRDVGVSQPTVCSGVSPARDGAVVTCGPVTATVPRTGGNLHDVRQRWRKTGQTAFAGGVESPAIPW